MVFILLSVGPWKIHAQGAVDLTPRLSPLPEKTQVKGLEEGIPAPLVLPL
jgi:hypothetical protein